MINVKIKDNINIVGEDVMEITSELAKCFKDNYVNCEVYAISDIKGEDHVYAMNNEKKPIFDMLVSTSRKFVFVWYYLHPRNGLEISDKLKDISLSNDKDFAIKYPNIPTKKLIPSILRYGKKPAGISLREYIIKSGNPEIEKQAFDEESLSTYRNYDWQNIPNALDLIKNKAIEMEKHFLTKRGKIDKLRNIRGRVLYAGCAYHYCYPKLGFGMRDIDVETFFSPDWFVNTRCALTQHCDIKEFGEPKYFKNQTRWLDNMWNSFHSEKGNFKEDVITYMDEMRHKSDRWATISQRPMIDLDTKEIIYKPNWLQKIEQVIRL